MSEATQIISTIGFPIFSFLLAGWGLKYVYDRERKSLDEAITRLTDLTQAINHNSETLTRLVDELNEKHITYEEWCERGKSNGKEGR